MKPYCIAAALVLLNAGCASRWPSATNQTVRTSSADTNAFVLHSSNGAKPEDATSKPPRLTVGVSYSDTQLVKRTKVDTN